jgi:phospholipase D1/2
MLIPGTEHLGLIPPQPALSKPDEITSFMMPAPTLNDDEVDSEDDRIVADPLSDDFINLWNTTATRNRGVFTELFRTVPSDLVASWDQYNVSRR